MNAGAQLVPVIIPAGHTMSTNQTLDDTETAALRLPVPEGRQFLNRDGRCRRDNHWRPVGHRPGAERLAALIGSLPL